MSSKNSQALSVYLKDTILNGLLSQWTQGWKVLNLLYSVLQDKKIATQISQRFSLISKNILHLSIVCYSAAGIMEQLE